MKNSSEKIVFKKPNFSIIIPTYNREKMVIRAIESVLNQSYKNIEIIVIDDCSTDNTKEIINGLFCKDKRIKYIRTKKNLGGAGARNFGVKESSGEFIAFLDSDDEALPHWLKISFYIIKKLPETWGCLYPRHLEKNELTGISYHSITPLKKGNIYKSLLEGKAMHIGASGVIVKKEVFKSICGFDETLRGFNDIDLFYRIAKNNTFHYINSPQIIMHHHRQDRLTNWNKERWKSYKIFLDKWIDEKIRLNGDFTYSDSISKNKKGMFFNNISQMVTDKNRFEAFKALVKYFLKTRLNIRYFFKCIIFIIFGGYVYDLFKKIRGIIYWGFFIK